MQYDVVHTREVMHVKSTSGKWLFGVDFGEPKANVCKTDFANVVGIFRKAACSLHDP